MSAAETPVRNGKLTDDEIREIMESPDSPSVVAERLGVLASTVRFHREKRGVYLEQQARQLQERDRQHEREKTAKRIRAEHAAAFARPLIDERLLTLRERREIRARVMTSPQRTWCSNGGGLAQTGRGPK